MSDGEIPKVLIYSQLDHGQVLLDGRGSGIQKKLKSNLSAVDVPHTNFRVVLYRNNWRYL